MSTSAGLEMRAGSRSETSWAMGKLSVWSAASGSGEGAGLLFGLQATTAMRTAISHAGGRIGGRLPEGCLLSQIRATTSQRVWVIAIREGRRGRASFLVRVAGWGRPSLVRRTPARQVESPKRAESYSAGVAQLG